jgi:hypothetical protein
MRCDGRFVVTARADGSICMPVVATENFYTTDRCWRSYNTAFVAMAKSPAAGARSRRHLSEPNRLFLQTWNVPPDRAGVAGCG